MSQTIQNRWFVTPHEGSAYAHMIYESGADGAVAVGATFEQVRAEQIAREHNAFAVVVEELEDMVRQNCHCQDGTYSHDSMSTHESAIRTLVELGRMKRAGGDFERYVFVEQQTIKHIDAAG